MYDLKFHVNYQRLVREGRAPALACPASECDAQLFISIDGDDVYYECWACDRTVILGLHALKSMDAYVEQNRVSQTS